MFSDIQVINKPPAGASVARAALDLRESRKTTRVAQVKNWAATDFARPDRAAFRAFFTVCRYFSKNLANFQRSKVVIQIASPRLHV
jgi:hypothetical protein